MVNCRFRGTCPALAVDGSDYCTVHQPERILDRAKNIVLNNLAPAITTSSPRTAALLERLRDDLLHDLDHTA